MLVEHRPDAGRRRADVRLPDHRHPRRLRDHRPRFLGPELVAASPVRRAVSHEAHRRRLLGLLPRPGLAGQLLPRRGRPRRPHLADPARPRQRRPRRAAPLRRPAGRRRASSSATSTPTTASTCAATTCCAGTTRTATSRGSRCGVPTAPPTGWRAPTTCRPTRACTRSSTSASTTAPVELGPFVVEPIAGRPPGAGLRPADRAPTARPSATPATPARAPGSTRSPPDVDLLLAEASFPSRDDNPPKLHLTGAECGEAATRAGARRLVLTHVPPWHDPQDALAEARTTYDGQIELAPPAPSSRSEVES